jgi:hypothetical protein
VPVVSGSTPSSRPPTGDAHPIAEQLAVELERAGDDVAAIERVLRRARDELSVIVRRPLAQLHADSADDLRELVVERGEGFTALDVSVALRVTPTFVRRARLAEGRDPEHGRRVSVNGNGTASVRGLELVANGYSVRAAALVVGLPRSTLGDHVRRAR